MRKIDRIFVHCADTDPSEDFVVQDIRNWHTWPKDLKSGGVRWQKHNYASRQDLPEDVRLKMGNGWDDIGYHWVVLDNGDCEPGRPEEIPGAHAKGYNRHSIGICLIGGNTWDNFTSATMVGLAEKLRDLRARYGNVPIDGHNVVDPGRACPNFDLPAFLAERNI